MARPPRLNSQAEIDAFVDVCERIGGFDHRTTAEWADGYLTAMAVGARSVAFEDCVAQMAGDAYERAFGDPEDRGRAARALQARIAALNDQLDGEALFDDPDHLRLTPFIMDWTDEDRAEMVSRGAVSAEQARQFVTGAEWADGFAHAVQDFGDRWPAAEDDDDAGYTRELAAQIAALALPDGSDELREHVRKTFGSDDGDRERLVDAACFAVQDLRLWVIDNAPRPQTRRAEKTPGRNDPCPCGSGKKYKKCHGAG